MPEREVAQLNQLQFFFAVLVKANAAQRSTNLALDTLPPRGGLVNNIRCASNNNFHARVSHSTSLCTGLGNFLETVRQRAFNVDGELNALPRRNTNRSQHTCDSQERSGR